MTKEMYQNNNADYAMEIINRFNVDDTIHFFEFSLRELVTDAFEKAGVVPRVLHTSEQLSTVESLIRSGTASGFLLRPLACGDASLAAIPLTPPVCVQVSLVWRRSRKPFRDMARLMDLCRTAQLF